MIEVGNSKETVLSFTLLLFAFFTHPFPDPTCKADSNYFPMHFEAIKTHNGKETELKVFFFPFSQEQNSRYHNQVKYKQQQNHRAKSKN
uniref:Uncharacterized protein n=1 Tax=Cucumis melo TaxID=3656 RepID=A0A9I9EHW2_CUCME